ncbi:MAG TPA: hypothetical protein VI112_11185 [Bacteroidia bacterium]|jgi:hypothetical protein
MTRSFIAVLFFLLAGLLTPAQRLPVCSYSNLGVALDHEFVRLKFYRDTFQCITHDSISRFTAVETLDNILCREAIYDRDHSIDKKYYVVLAFDSATPFAVVDHVMMELKYEEKNLILFLAQNAFGKSSGIVTLNPTIITGMEYSKKYYGERYLNGSDVTCYHKMFPEEKMEDLPPPPPPPPPPTFKTIDPIGMYIKGKQENNLTGVAMITIKSGRLFLNGSSIGPDKLIREVKEKNMVCLLRFSDDNTYNEVMQVLGLFFPADVTFRMLSRTEREYIDASIKK